MARAKGWFGRNLRRHMKQDRWLCAKRADQSNFLIQKGKRRL
jgi:hypothetical protein